MAKDRPSPDDTPARERGWRAAYISVAVFTLAVIGLLYLFSRYFGG